MPDYHTAGPLAALFGPRHSMSAVRIRITPIERVAIRQAIARLIASEDVDAYRTELRDILGWQRFVFWMNAARRGLDLDIVVDW